jgi:urease accessory protein
MIAPAFKRGMFMRAALLLAVAVLLAGSDAAWAHHVMGGRMPATFFEGLLSGLGHPIIGLDHFATLVAAGCLAAWHRSGAILVIGFVVAMIVGVIAHLAGMTVPGAEIFVACSVLALGIILIRREVPTVAYEAVLFAFAGFVNGYALGESIYGAEQTPLAAYLLGLAAIQCAVALGAMAVAKFVLRRQASEPTPLRLTGAGIVGIGLAVLMQQIVPGV